MNNKLEIHFIGGGAWGQSLAIALSRIGINSSILVTDQNRVENFRNNISSCFPNIKFPNRVIAYTNENNLRNADIIFITTQSFRVENCIKKVNKIKNNPKIVLTSKGFANKNGKTFPEFISKEFPQLTYGILSGPTFAIDIANNVPSAAAIASGNNEFSMYISNLFYKSCLRLYPTNDVIGVSVAGAVKNIFAIGAGVLEGLKLGDNTKSALITRGIAEISKLINNLGGEKKTAFGLAGIGDMILTCSSQNSRNMRYGMDLVNNKIREKNLVEGLYALEAVKNIYNDKEINTPLINAIDDYLNNNVEIKVIIDQLLRRPINFEFRE